MIINILTIACNNTQNYYTTYVIITYLKHEPAYIACRANI